jgi:hypothetical protein
MSEWQPIETAPRDGQRVLMLTAKHYVITGFFSNGWWLSHPGVYQIHPTHWMPLPEPPK